MEDLLLRTHPCICSRGWFPLCHTSSRLCCLWCCAAWSTQRRTAAQEGSNSELNSPVFPMAHGGFPRGSSSIRIPKKEKGVVRHLVDPIRCWNFPSSQWGWQRRLLLFPETNSNQSLKTDKYKLMAPIGVWLIMELFWFILKKKTSFSTVYCIRFGRLWGLETVKDTCVIKSWPKRAQIITDKSKLQIWLP